MVRGNAGIAPEDVLLLYELLRDRAVSLLELVLGASTANDSGKTQDTLHTGFKFSGTKSDGKTVKVDINIPQKSIPAGQIEEIVGATRNFFEALGFAQTSENDPEFGSFFQELVFTSSATTAVADWITNVLTNRPRIRQEVSATEAETHAVSHKQAEAATRLLEALNSFDEAVIRMGNILIVKTTVGDKRQLRVLQLNEEVIRQINEQPELMKSPVGILEFLGDAAEEINIQPGTTRR